MKYTVNLDENNYILSIANTQHDNIELDLSSINMEYAGAYKLINGELILDENKLQELIADNTRIDNFHETTELQNNLNSTDYIVSKCFEEIMALDNKLTFITDMIAILVKYSKQYKDVLVQRKTWRARIEELQNKQ